MKSIVLNIVDKAGSLAATLQHISDKSVDLKFVAAWRVGDGFGIAHLMPKNQEKISEIVESRDSSLGVADPLVVDVLTIKIANRTGTLQSLLSALASEDINIDYCFTFSKNETEAVAILILPHYKIDSAREILITAKLVGIEDFSVW